LINAFKIKCPPKPEGIFFVSYSIAKAICLLVFIFENYF